MKILVLALLIPATLIGGLWVWAAWPTTPVVSAPVQPVFTPNVVTVENPAVVAKAVPLRQPTHYTEPTPLPVAPPVTFYQPAPIVSNYHPTPFPTPEPTCPPTMLMGPGGDCFVPAGH